MAGKKGAAIQLQQEVNTNEEWEEMIKKPGLTVVDVYSGWCGPCVGMVGNLKKVKLEIGGDLLHLAIAKADNITCLKRFRNKSEPTWMFVSNGKMIKLMFGANAPRLIKLMTEEIHNEGEFQKGHLVRDGIGFDELTPEEQERANIEKAKEEEKKAAREAALNLEFEKRRKKIIKRLVNELKYDSVILFLPFLHNKESQIWHGYDKLMEILGMEFSSKKESLVELQLEDAEKLFGVYDEDLTEELKKHLAEGPCLAKIIGIPNPEPPADEEGAEGEVIEEPEPIPEEPEAAEEEEEKQPVIVVEAVHNAIYGGGASADLGLEEEEPFGDEEEEGEEGALPLITQLFHEYADITSLPALWAPATDEQKAEAVFILFPAYVDELMGPPPPPLPPHLAIIFEASKYPELSDSLEEYKDDVIHSGFFDGANPDTAKRMAATYNDYLLSKKTGNEKFVVMLNNSRSDPVLALSQLSPVYVSLNQDDGKEDCEKFFPEEEEQEVTEPEKIVDVIEVYQDDSMGIPEVVEQDEDNVSRLSVESYDPTKYRETQEVESAGSLISIVSGFEVAGPSEEKVEGSPDEETVKEADGAPAGDAQPAADSTAEAVPSAMEAESGAEEAADAPAPVDNASPAPDAAAPDEAAPDEATPDEAAPDEATPDEAAPTDAAPTDAAPAEAAPDEAVPDEAAAEEVKATAAEEEKPTGEAIEGG